MPEPRYAIGLDFGTESARAVLVNIADGHVAATAVAPYVHGVMDRALPDGTPLGHEWALQHPRDYLDALAETIRRVVTESGAKPAQVTGIGVDFTACTILPTDEKNVPLCLHEQFAKTANAWVKLWKHHAAQPQADRMTRLAEERAAEWLKVYGYRLSSEWLIPKALQIAEEAPEVWEAAAHVVEAGDWVVQQLSGRAKVRSACNAGYKACYVKGMGGYPSDDFLRALDPKLATLVPEKLAGEIRPPGARAGGLTPAWAETLGLRAGTPVAVEIIDAHAAVPGCGVSEPHVMVMVMGTSTCHMMMSRDRAFVPGVAGVIEDGILPGFFGYEAGQSSVGDHFAWHVRQGLPEDYRREAESRGIDAHRLLTEKAAAQRPGEHGLLALDWWNGNRSILMDADLTGCMIGFTLATRPEDIYRALIEATAYGTRVIIEAFEEGGVRVEGLVACGGLAAKNDMLMQIYADVLDRPIKVAAAEHTSALGAAILGAVAAGADGGHESLRAATACMVEPPSRTFAPIAENARTYGRLFAEYRTLHVYFGGAKPGEKPLNDVMKRLREIRSA